MATIVPKLSSGGAVKIRFTSIDLGTTRWKEGTFEILEKDNKVNLCLRFNCGGATKTFQLNQNVKTISQNMNRIMLTLKDNCVITLDKMPSTLVQRTKEYLEKLKQGKPILKSSHGSANFSVLGNRAVKNETSPPGERQTPNIFQTTQRRQSAEGREDTTPRKPLSSPSRAASTPTRTGLSENRSEKRKRLLNSESDLTEDYPKENDSSSNNKATSDPSRKYLLSCKDKLKQAEENRSSAPLGSTPLQPTTFYGSRSVTKDYSQSHSFLDRPSSTGQTTTAKRSLMLPNHSTPFKKVRPSLDYGGWNKQRPSSLAQPQPPLQGFSNLGNTCYMNAILQSLFSLPSFSNDMLKQSIPWKKVPINALLRRFAHLMAKKDVGCPETKKDLLRKVKSAISSTAERFSGNMQNDAHEFLSQCLDQLKDDVEKMNKSWTNEAAASSSSSVACENGQEAIPSATKTEPGEEVDTSRIYTCPVAVNMEFEVQHTIICKGCGEVVTKREQFNDLSIDLPRRKKTLPLRSIQDSLDLFFRMEEIEYSCEKCNGKAATVTHKFSKLPRVLILHLKRYSFNAQLSLNSKLGQQVVIPRYLTLLSHCTESTRPPISLGWSSQASMSRTLKTSQLVNSSTAPLRRFGGKVANSSCTSILLDSDCEEEQPSRKVSASRKRRLSSCLPDDDDRPEERRATIDSADFSGINDDEMLDAVLEMSRQEAGLSAPPPVEDEPTSSPDTGFGDTDAHDLAYHTDLLETETKQPADVLDSLDLTMDENKENQTPEGVQQQGELDWVQQYSLDQEREEQELQQALAQSLQEHEAQEMREDDDLKRATELSLQEFNNSLPDLLCSDDDSGNEDVLDMEYTEAEAENLKRNAESGDLANSFRLISVVSHIGSSSSSGHYISDVYDMKKQSWLTYNDLDVSRTQEAAVQRDRDRSGYIFFYMHKDVFEQLSEMERSGASSTSEAGRNVLQPL
ncbi:ubiquitin carboxyl-terminal hydrolase 37 isoform X1 [Morone saxatilis]|uniref:ubiquitin carboxyl-terminal hydrolase 37 isoform X1 n=1 Tax=Morone saxatilis TaxID=34816 RepID=UPI0015E20E99|nr:ubiquitin carboxyl-terminal hydrolase 37 isoform X1 [Morone saxatilis]XP_035532566.1 ubiquitin carboxyl-terminal hydrolase 37 isoform X1 [Morone saxatilis]XP_035532567.1 ubiquitin carboxyl-terminal hydrolase 37 isoform X1 [Morone saxatilis]XP_035532568.1 ubiquitin carboxyl-terminal hydrolase 37 isoform X1 [Morone saxatilis]XP_035532569.1 ubiquitin carboxyl-terminal hydrolase 37 isoform X1 [Morone saxatilis]